MSMNQNPNETMTEDQIREELVTAAREALDKFTGEGAYAEMSELDKAQFWSDNLTRRFFNIWHGKDAPSEVVVEASLFEAVSAGLQIGEIPEGAPLPEGINMEETREQFKAFCSNIPVRIVPIDQLIAPPETGVDPAEQFVVIVTDKMKKAGFLMRFDQMLGLSQTLANSRIPIQLSEGDLELLFKIHLMMQCEGQRQQEAAAARAQAPQINAPQTAQPAPNVQLFTP